jgi:hypothetical protein
MSLREEVAKKFAETTKRVVSRDAELKRWGASQKRNAFLAYSKLLEAQRDNLALVETVVFLSQENDFLARDNQRQAVELATGEVAETATLSPVIEKR